MLIRIKSTCIARVQVEEEVVVVPEEVPEEVEVDVVKGVVVTRLLSTVWQGVMLVNPPSRGLAAATAAGDLIL